MASGQAMAASSCTAAAAGGVWGTADATWLNAVAADGCNSAAGAGDSSPDSSGVGTDDVIIPSTTAPVTIDGSLGTTSAKSVTINAGGKLSLDSGIELFINGGNFTNNATAADVVLTGGTVTFDGTTPSTVGGSTVTTFGNLKTDGGGGAGALTLPTGAASSIINGNLTINGSGAITGTVKFSNTVPVHGIINSSSAKTIATLDVSLFTGTKTIQLTGGNLLTVTTLIPPSTASAAVSIAVNPPSNTLTVTNAPTGATCTTDAAVTGTQAATTFPVTALAAGKTLVCTTNAGGGGGGGAVSAPIFSIGGKPTVFSEEVK